jgi:hypothetical protein
LSQILQGTRLSRGAYARGKKALGICDRCGLTYKLDQLKTETVNLSRTNLRVCPVCWDPDHPQNWQGRIDYSDPEALRDPRPDSADGTSPSDRFITSSSSDFTNSADGWVSPPAFSTLTLNDTYLTLSANAYKTQGLNRTRSGTALDIDTSIYKIVRAMIRVDDIGDARTWRGQFGWIRTTDSSTAANRFQYISEPDGLYAFGDRWVLIEWDLTDEAEWTGTVDGARVNPIEGINSIIDFDYIRFESR